MIKLAAAVAGSGTAFILAATGYVAGATQTPAVLEGIRWVMTLVPAALILTALVPLWFHRLDEERFAAVLADLEERSG